MASTSAEGSVWTRQISRNMAGSPHSFETRSVRSELAAGDVAVVDGAIAVAHGERVADPDHGLDVRLQLVEQIVDRQTVGPDDHAVDAVERLHLPGEHIHQ